MDWLDLLAVQGTLKSLLLEKINSLALSLLYGPTLTSICDYWKRLGLYNQNVLVDHSCWTPWKEREVIQSCLTLCDPMDCSLPGFSIHGISRQEYWSELPFPSPGDLPNPGIKPRSPTLQADFLPAEPQGKPRLHEIICQIYSQVSIYSYLGRGS